MDGNGLATLGELTGYTRIEYDLGSAEQSQDENYLHAEIFRS